MNKISKGGAHNSRLLIFSAILLSITLIFGGSSTPQVLSTTLVRVAAIVALGYMLHRSPWRPSKEGWFAIACLSLIACQLLPLPFTIWSEMPGRTLEVSIAGLLPDRRPWQPISFYPLGTWNALLSWLPPIALYWMARTCDAQGQRTLILCMMAIAVASAVLGLLQMGQGPASPLRFYALTNPEAAVALFANRNHAAIFLASGAVMMLWWAGEASTDRFPKSSRRIAGFAATAILFGGLVATGSRAGIALGIFGLVVGLGTFHYQWMRTAKRRYVAIALGALISTGIVAWVAFSPLLGRLFAASLADDLRFLVLPDLVDIAKNLFPFGAGFGTFDTTYTVFEKVETMQSAYLNHAHNDLIELIIEGGLPALVLFLIAFLWIVRCAWRVSSTVYAQKTNKLAVAAVIVIVMLLIHSLLDYPLRTPALACLFALCAAILAASVERNIGAARLPLGFVDSSKGPSYSLATSTDPIERGGSTSMKRAYDE